VENAMWPSRHSQKLQGRKSNYLGRNIDLPEQLLLMTQLQIPTTQWTTVSFVLSRSSTLHLNYGSSAVCARAGVMKHAVLGKGAGGLSVTFVTN